ncbi:hypothetical protein ACFSKU_12770 [Pontibacter silvestris]|uniref:Uncharacterized protein n=1 Tax=Pontibacter silvestris TaxID=2305183 RepID=A0ABW4X026_9BACT|nr:hypothetical protein [Pontibacter silvestris]MCC9138449.1 hypothetical protein [Pontibacter silvestris]
MSAKSFELLVEQAYAPEMPIAFGASTATIYKKFEEEFKLTLKKGGRPSDELNFRFERLRLGIALAFVKAYSRLSDNEGVKEVLALLQEALQAKSTREIDKIIQKKIAAFDHLYHEIFVNEQREQLLALFEQTIDAGSKEELDELIMQGLELLQEIDFNAASEDEDDEDSIDEDFIKSIT